MNYTRLLFDIKVVKSPSLDKRMNLINVFVFALSAFPIQKKLLMRGVFYTLFNEVE